MDGTDLVYRNWNREHNVTISNEYFVQRDTLYEWRSLLKMHRYYANKTVCMPNVITNYTTSVTECSAISTHYLGSDVWFPVNCSQKYRHAAVVCQNKLESHLKKRVLNRSPNECGINELSINTHGLQFCVKIQNTGITNNGYQYAFTHYMRHATLHIIARYALRLNYQKIKMKRQSNSVKKEQCLFLESYDHIMKQQITGDIGFHSYTHNCSENGRLDCNAIYAYC